MPSEDSSKPPLGANGIKIRDGYLHFTNSGREIFCSVENDMEEKTAGEIKVPQSNENAQKPQDGVQNKYTSAD